MCDNWKNKYEINFTKAEFKKIILTLRLKYNCDYIRFHGQEATLYSDLNDLIDFSKKMKMRVALKTNGWLLTDKRLYKALDIGLDELYLSVDSGEEKLHDEIRWIPGSFDKNIDLVIKTKKYAPNVKVYFNSVVMAQSYKTLPKLLDVCQKYGVDRQSFVFLNDKNRKDIGHVNLSKKQFTDFFYHELLEIYRKSIAYNIPVDFSPFVSEFVWEKPEFILEQLTWKNKKFQYQIENFYTWFYGRDFYDRYGCQGPLDHASINYNGDMFGCCVVERDRWNKVWNVIDDDLSWLWNDQRYKLYRQRSNFWCSYGKKCASNFNTRKQLFQETYLDESIFDMNHPYNYYRYIKEINNESESKLGQRRNIKIQLLLSSIVKHNKWYQNICEWLDIQMWNISEKDFHSLPIISKNELSELYDFIDKDVISSDDTMKWHTSGSSGFRLDFIAPLNFRRHVKQIAMFSQVSNFSFYDWFYSFTPTNCDQGSRDRELLPSYVKKQYIAVWEFLYTKSEFDSIKSDFQNQSYNYIYWDSKYIFYVILLYEKFGEQLPKIEHIFLSYSFTNRSLRKFIEKSFSCEITEIYGCSEVWPIGYSQDGWAYNIFGDNLVVEQQEGNIVITDLENDLFPFIRYKNGDTWRVIDNTFCFEGKKWQEICGYSLREIDDYIYESCQEIIYYQFIWNTFLYYSKINIETLKIEKLLKSKFWKIYNIKKRGEDVFFQISTECGKYKTINIK